MSKKTELRIHMQRHDGVLPKIEVYPFGVVCADEEQFRSYAEAFLERAYAVNTEIYKATLVEWGIFSLDVASGEVRITGVRR